VRLEADGVYIVDPAGTRERMAELARRAALSSPDEKAQAQYLIRLIAQAMGAIPASIYELYRARGQGQVPLTFTVPALNLRSLPFLAARQVFRVMKELDTAAVIFEISRSEMSSSKGTTSRSRPSVSRRRPRRSCAPCRT